MTDRRIENVNVFAEEPLLTPLELKQRYPLSEKAVETVLQAQQSVKKILLRKDHRLFVVVGPCSIHDVKAAREYAVRLKDLADELEDTLLLIMRVYFEKPRTRIGWQGLINDPFLDNSCQIEEGLKLARKLLLDLAELGLPVAGEALDLISPQYVQDLTSWTAIGARTTESQTHRKMASGFTSPVGFKNGTDGSLDVAINAIHAAAKSNDFLSVDPPGQVAVVRTKGNPYTHIVLRGGGGKPNFDVTAIADCEQALEGTGLKANIMVDCSHANSGKDPVRQLEVLKDIAQQISNGNRSIVGLMLESHLREGSQPIPKDLTQLDYGISITDPCLSWAETEKALRALSENLKLILPSRVKLKLGS